jgi:hypothetical protein
MINFTPFPSPPTKAAASYSRIHPTTSCERRLLSVHISFILSYSEQHSLSNRLALFFSALSIQGNAITSLPAYGWMPGLVV